MKEEEKGKGGLPTPQKSSTALKPRPAQSSQGTGVLALPRCGGRMNTRDALTPFHPLGKEKPVAIPHLLSLLVRWQYDDGDRRIWRCHGARRAQGYCPLLPAGLQGRVRAGGAQHLGANPTFSFLSGARVGRRSKMKLWDVVAVCVVLLNTVSTSPLPAGKMPPEGPPSVVEGPEDDLSPISLPPPYAVHSDCKKHSPL